MKTIRYYLSVATYFAKLAITRQLEYPSFLVSWFLMIPLQYFAGIWMLYMIVEKFQSLNGWDFPALTFVYGLGLISHGLQVVFFIQTWGMERMVIHGEFDRMLLRPMNVFFQFIVMYINFIGLIDLIPGTIIFLYGCKLVNFQWTLPNTLLLLVVIVGAVFIRAAIFTITGSIAFWTKRSGALVDLNLAVLQRTTMYPLSIYSTLIQNIFTFLIPIGFICFYPACAFLGMDDRSVLPLDLIVWTPLIGGLSFYLSQIVFKQGLKKYESCGS